MLKKQGIVYLLNFVFFQTNNIINHDLEILIRFTPGIECHTHDYIRTGSFDSKFGFGIEYLNNLHDEGHFIHYYTARGALTGIDHLKETREQLDEWGVKYNDLAVFKPFYDVWIDDKAVGVRRDSEGSISEFKNNIEEAIRTS